MADGFEIDVRQYCKGCTEFRSEETYSVNAAGELIWTIQCENRGQCVRLMRHLTKKMEARDESKMAD